MSIEGILLVFAGAVFLVAGLYGLGIGAGFLALVVAGLGFGAIVVGLWYLATKKE